MSAVVIELHNRTAESVRDSWIQPDDTLLKYQGVFFLPAMQVAMNLWRENTKPMAIRVDLLLSIAFMVE
jgi:hypothetical protein